MCDDKTNQEKCEQESFHGQLKRMMLAAMGAAAMAQEEFEGFVGKLVERGEIAEQEGKKWVKEIVDKRRKITKDAVQTIEENSLDGLDKLLQKLNIPSKKDVDTLAKKIDDLTKRVDELFQKNNPV
ncbi:MAG: phasin family protein [Candidatus Brocadiae bacterium]|nr:phasin family protein [Candidatus Brocadiia bacterium]